MRRAGLVVIVWAALTAPAVAQFVVIDPANLAQAILIADRTLREYDTLLQQYETILKMARGLGSLDRYRTPSIAITGHDPGRWPYAAPWLQGLNSGDARGTLYEQVARRVKRPGVILTSLPPNARQAIENAYATIEITDSVAEIAGHQVALVRNYNGTLQRLLQEFERDVLNGLPQYHDMTAVLDKVATGELLARRQDAATNQLLSHALEQLLARSKRLRDTEAATMNMRLLGMREGRTAGTNLIDGSAEALRTWRQP
jgi:conjugal transfer/entry exclusion protein